MDTPTIHGLHHVTGITGDVQRNVDFYTRTLGLRLVKVTINYDDPGSYHLYYGDTLGRPGTVLTFFGWPGGHRAAAGTGRVGETAFHVPTGAAGFWAKRLAAEKVAGVESSVRFGAHVVTFRDPDGLPLAVVEAADASDVYFWEHGGVAREVALRGFHSVTLAETEERYPAAILVDRFGYREIGREGERVRYEIAGAATAGATGRVVDVLRHPTAVRARMGVGEIHHVAFGTPTDEQQARWLEMLRGDGHNVSPVMDRDYFHSIYFREAGGTLFEIATDLPGFTVNERAEELGTKVMLPKWLEGHRVEVEKALPGLRLAERVG